MKRTHTSPVQYFIITTSREFMPSPHTVLSTLVVSCQDPSSHETTYTVWYVIYSTVLYSTVNLSRMPRFARLSPQR